MAVASWWTRRNQGSTNGRQWGLWTLLNQGSTDKRDQDGTGPGYGHARGGLAMAGSGDGGTEAVLAGGAAAMAQGDRARQGSGSTEARRNCWSRPKGG